MARLRAAAIALGCGLSISARIERLRELRENNWLYGMSSGKLLSKSVKRKPGLDNLSGSLYVGNNDTSVGSFKQSGGIARASNIRVSHKGRNSFELRGGQTESSGAFGVGYSENSVGSVEQSGGTNTIGGVVTLGELAGSEGSYELSDGRLEVGDDALIGNNGKGHFAMHGGTALIDGYLKIGYRSTAVGSFDLYSGALCFTNSDASAKSINVGSGSGGQGVLHLGNAEGCGEISNMVESANFALITVGGQSTLGSVRGWGTYPFKELVSSGRVIADGYGTERDLNLLPNGGTVRSTTENGSSNGWFAVNGGRLILPDKSVEGSDVQTWGENPVGLAYATNKYYHVNSVRVSRVTDAGTLSGSLLATDRSDVPSGLYKPLAVWDFTDSDFGATARIRYDDVMAEACNLQPEKLRIYQHNGSGWVSLASTVDTDKKTITATLAKPLGKFAVASFVPGLIMTIQ